MGKILRELRQIFRMKTARDTRERRLGEMKLDMGSQLKLMGRFGQELVLEARN